MMLATWIALVGLGQVASDDSSSTTEKLKAVAFLEGEWEGEGWMLMGPQSRESIAVKESVRFKLSGRALLIEGLGTMKDPQTGREKVVHEALAVLTWDTRRNEYSMRAITAKAGAVDPKVEVGDGKLVWGFEAPNGGSVRYTITINEKGQWSEIGEFSRDGKEWNKFFEMNLSKVK